MNYCPKLNLFKNNSTIVVIFLKIVDDPPNGQITSFFYKAYVY